jgi:hypothetical protein
MKWSEFKTLVLGFMPVEAARVNAGTFVDQHMRQACLIIMGLLPRYQQNQEETYEETDLTVDGLASTGNLPPGAKLREAYLIRTYTNDEGTTINARHPVEAELAWDRRYELVSGQYRIPDNNGVMALNPVGAAGGQEFYVFPQVLAASVEEGKTYAYQLVVKYDGKKFDYTDEDDVPFDEPMAGVVADYVLAETTRGIEKDAGLHKSYADSYKGKLTALYLQ